MDTLSTTPANDGDVEETIDTETEPTETAGSEQAEDTQVEADANGETREATPQETTEYDEAWDKIDTEVGFEEFFSEQPQTTGSEEESQVEQAEEKPVEEAPKGLVIENPVLKFKGKEIPIESAEELLTLAQKGLRFEIDMGKIKPHKRAIRLMEESNISEEHLKALADALSGKREAVEYIAREAGIELKDESVNLFSDDTEPQGGDYKPAVEPQDPVKEFWDAFTQDNPTESAKVIEVYNDLDETFKAEIYKPDVFPLFVGSVTSGEFEKAYPVALKLKAMNPAANWLQVYAQAVQSLAGEEAPVVPEKKEPPAAVHVSKPTVRETKPVKEKDIEKRIWEDDSYEEELLNKLFG